MGRPRLPVGNHGNIRIRPAGKAWIAATYVRDGDGRRREIRREGRTKSAALNKLQAALTERPGFGQGDIDRDSTIAQTAALWFAQIEHQVATGDRAPNTHRIYDSVYREHVRDAVGELRLHEATVSRLDAFVVSMRSHHGASLTKTARTVLNGILGYAVRNGAIPRNPMADVSRVAGGPAKIPRALTLAEREEWLQKMQADLLALKNDIPDITRFLLGTGARIGECCAATFDDIDFMARTIRIDHGVTRVTGKGLARGKTKTPSSRRTLHLPDATVAMLERRFAILGDGPVFPGNDDGGWRDPSNTGKAFKEARERAGFDWVTSHVFRKTVATILDEAGLTSRVVADQLGHSRVSITQDVYMGRQAVGDAAARALDAANGAAG
jgi:integrase